MFGDCLFGEVKLNKNPDPDKYGESCYGLGFDTRSQFSLTNGQWSKNVIFGVGNSSYVQADNGKNW